MNRKTAIAAAALAAASLSAIAADATHSSLTREEVKAELRDAKAAGLYEPNQEASATPLDDQHRNQMFVQAYGEDHLQKTAVPRDDLMALVDREDEAPVIIIEAPQQDEGRPIDKRGGLPYDPPAVRDGSPSDEAPQVPAQ